MKFSVLMSVYKNDNPLWLNEAIESVINNTVKPNDFVIVKDGPLPNELNNIIDKYKKEYNNLFTIIQNKENLGLGLSLNKGVLKCKYELIARMDADDICHKERFEKQLDAFKNNDIDICGSMAKEFKNDINDNEGFAIFPLTHKDIVNFSKKRNPFCHPSIMFKKQVVLKAGNYQDCHLCEDYDLWTRMISSGAKCYNINEKLLYWRINDNFYKRRSGIKYLKSILAFFKKLYKTNYLTLSQYIKAIIIRTTVYLIPNKLRKFIYKNFLRSKNKND